MHALFFFILKKVMSACFIFYFFYKNIPISEFCKKKRKKNETKEKEGKNKNKNKPPLFYPTGKSW